MAGRMSAAVERALELVKQGMTMQAAAKQTGCNRSSVFRAIQRAQEKTKQESVNESKQAPSGG